MEKDEEVKLLRSNIMKFIYSMHSHGLYLNERFLLEEVSYVGLKGICLEPDLQLQPFFSKDKHMPIAEILCLALDSEMNEL